MLNSALAGRGSPAFSLGFTSNGASRWIIPFALKDLGYFPEGWTYVGMEHYPIQEIHKEFTIKELNQDTLIFFFDSAYTGTHVVDMLWDISRSLKGYTNVFIVIPFATEKALKNIREQKLPSEIKLELITSKIRLKTVKECISAMDLITLRELINVPPNVIKALSLSYSNWQSHLTSSLLSVDWNQGIAV